MSQWIFLTYYLAFFSVGQHGTSARSLSLCVSDTYPLSAFGCPIPVINNVKDFEYVQSFLILITSINVDTSHSTILFAILVSHAFKFTPNILGFHDGFFI